MASESGAIVAKEVVRSLLPSSWSSGGTERRVAQLQVNSQEYRSAAARVTAARDYEVSVQRIVRNEHPLMYASFLLSFEKTKRLMGSASVRSLFHDTAASNVDSILESNLGWTRVTTTDKINIGVSFKTDSDHAMGFSNLGNGAMRAMLITDVIVGRATDTLVAGGRFPPSGYDTTTANGGKVMVKYKDDEFYVRYVVYYTLNKRRYQFTSIRYQQPASSEVSSSGVYTSYRRYDPYSRFDDDDYGGPGYDSFEGCDSDH